MRYLSLLLLATVLVVSCNNYGKKVSKEYLEIYYTDGVSRETAERTLEFLYPQWKLPDGSPTPKKSVQLDQKGDTVLFRMVADMAIVDETGNDIFLLMAQELSTSVFQSAPVTIEFTDKAFKTIRTLSFQKEPDFGELVTTGEIEVYITEGATREEGTRTQRFLSDLMGEGKAISVQISKDRNDGYLVKMAYNKAYAATLPDSNFYTIVDMLSRDVFNDQHVTLELTDEYFHTFRTFSQKTGSQQGYD